MTFRAVEEEREGMAVGTFTGTKGRLPGAGKTLAGVNCSMLLPITVLGSPKQRSRLEGIQNGGGRGRKLSYSI